MFQFDVLARNGNGRAGVFHTPHGVIETPIFMPVGTQGSVKALSPEDVHGTGAQILLGNTYHLYLRPGDELIRNAGGLHTFMRWDGAILTDSGGYQVSSLGSFKHNGKHLSQISEEGVTFKSHIDGSVHLLSPERVMAIQQNLGSDIMMAFDEATPDLGERYAKESMDRTHRWLDRCISSWTNTETQALFGIIQGGIYKTLRRESAAYVLAKNLPGIALGGASIGQDPDQTEENVSWVRDLLPKDKPIYFMGLGVKPSDVVAAIKSGADMFDCVAPTKLARTGLLYVGHLEGMTFVSEYENERITIEKKEFELDNRPIEDHCDCYTCSHGFSRSYLRHLFKSRELLYYRLASIHNVRMMIKLTQDVRSFILRFSLP
jgi:queuine tRNA-ribosyltransferase